VSQYVTNRAGKFKEIAPKAILKTAPHRTAPSLAATASSETVLFLCAAIFAVPRRPAPREKTASRET